MAYSDKKEWGKCGNLSSCYSLFSKEKGLDIFSSKKLAHGKEYKGLQT